MADDLESEIGDMSRSISSAEQLIENLTSKTQEDEEAMEEIMDAVKKLLDTIHSNATLTAEGCFSVSIETINALRKVHREYA
jgi:chorismate mutase